MEYDSGLKKQTLFGRVLKKPIGLSDETIFDDQHRKNSREQKMVKLLSFYYIQNRTIYNSLFGRGLRDFKEKFT
jgi:hypothetical protein